MRNGSTDPALVSPAFQPGLWSGVTYRAYIDFLRAPAGGASYVTVDTDFGCGLLAKWPATAPRRAGPEPKSADARERLDREWIAVRDDDERRYAFFDRHRAHLLRLSTVDEFPAGCGG